jgi:hypothetical protein
MSCYKPLKAFVLGTNPENGKKIIKVVNREYDGEELSCAGIEQIGIPCGKCIGCRLDYSRTWADRMLAEASLYDNNIFLTLTYDDEHLPPKHENSPIHSLNKRDAQLFMKRLRKALPEQKIRFFCAGEYGPYSMRPHFHLILFNCKLPDLKFLRENDLKQPYFISETISKVWPYGFHIIADCNWETCAYVARYVVKKQKGAGADVYEKYNFTPEFSTMSRKPGIGHDFAVDHMEELYAYGSINLPTQNGSKSIHPNKYYDNLFDIEYPEVLENIKIDRQEAAIQYNKIRSSLTNLNYQDMLKSSEINKEATVKALRRKEL